MVGHDRLSWVVGFVHGVSFVAWELHVQQRVDKNLVDWQSGEYREKDEREVGREAVGGFPDAGLPLVGLTDESGECSLHGLPFKGRGSIEGIGVTGQGNGRKLLRGRGLVIRWLLKSVR